MSHIIFVNRYFYPDHSATSQMLTDLAFHLTARGHQVEVVTSRQIYDDPGARLPPFEQVEGVSIRRLQATRFGRQHLAGRSLDYLTFHLRAWFHLRKSAPGSVIVAMTDPPLIGVTAALAVRGRALALVNWIQDLFPEVAEQLGVLRNHGPAAGIARRLRDGSLRQARLNIVLGEGMRAAVEERGAATRVIANWSHGDQIRPVHPDENPLRKQWSLDRRFVVGYSGNLGRAHEFESLVNAADRLRDVTFLLIGGGPREVELRREVDRRGLEATVLFRPYQPRERLSESLGAADVHLVSLRPGMERLIVPSKIYGVLAAARPVIFIGASGGDLAALVRENQCGLVVEPGDGEGLAESIRLLRDDPDLRATMGERARALFLKQFDAPIAYAEWEEVLRALDATD